MNEESPRPLPPVKARRDTNGGDETLQPGASRAAIRRLAGVIIGLGSMIGATYFVPQLRHFRPWVPGSGYVPYWNIVGREFMGQGKQLEAEAEKLAALQLKTRARSPSTAPSEPQPSEPALPPTPVFPPYSARETVERPERGIEPPEALDHYFRRLTLADLGVPGTVVRAGHWGDSVLGVDGITSGIRNRLQTRFGDAGHGYHLIDRYNPSYRHQGITFMPGAGWSRCLVVFECNKRNHRYGYGGLVVHSNGGATATWSTPSTGFGQTVTRFELWFAQQEKGGNFELSVDQAETIIVPTAGPESEDAWREVRVPKGPHSFRLRTIGGGDARAYGVVLENDGPGVVWDGMALIGGSTRGLRTQDPEHIASQIRHRDLDLLVFMFGGNDMERNYVDLKKSMDPYYDEYGDVLKHFRAGKPEASCLIMSITDHGERTADDNIVSRSFAKRLSRAQREVARRNGCGFFDTYEATGGEGTVARWYRARPRLIAPDLGHPNGSGHEVIAGLLTNAILYAYQEYRARMVGKPLPELDQGTADAGAPVRPREPTNGQPDNDASDAESDE